jgi:hypothetical protein
MLHCLLFPLLERVRIGIILGLSVDIALLNSLEHTSVFHTFSGLAMVLAAKERVDVLERNALGLGEEEVTEQREEDVEPGEEEECVPLGLGEEDWEGLLQDRVGYVLGLGGHCDSSGARFHVLQVYVRVVWEIL